MWISLKLFLEVVNKLVVNTFLIDCPCATASKQTSMWWWLLNSPLRTPNKSLRISPKTNFRLISSVKLKILKNGEIHTSRGLDWALFFLVNVLLIWLGFLLFVTVAVLHLWPECNFQLAFSIWIMSRNSSSLQTDTRHVLLVKLVYYASFKTEYQREFDCTHNTSVRYIKSNFFWNWSVQRCIKNVLS